jgi:SAM-dependent methyltransferase
MNLRIHLSIIQPPGYIHSQGFLDQARFARHQFRKLGAEVTIGKNRLREDAVNIVFGAHLGFDAKLKDRYTCVFLNLEQLGDGGASVSNDYIHLLSSSAVIDYEVRNLAAYGCKDGDIPIVSFQYASYLSGTPPLPLEDRPIDLLFFGSINERRKAIFQRIEACGWSVSRFDHPLYGEERDHFIRQSKAVFNCHFYESSRFEQARAFHTLSLGTPVISERTEKTTPPPAFEDTLTWVKDKELETFFTEEFMKPRWLEQAQKQLQAFVKTDASPSWQLAKVYCQAFWDLGGQEKAQQIWRPTQMNLGSGKDYKAGWLNVDILERTQPDLVLDLGQQVTFPITARTLGGGNVLLEENSLDAIYANNVLEHVPDLPCLMTNLLALLKENGEIEIEVPFEKSMTAWQDPTHLRAMNLNSWLYYTSWFWYLGWFEHRFEMVHFQWLDSKVQPCEESHAAFMKIKLKKICTTPHERSIARTMRPDFGGLENDVPEDLPVIEVKNDSLKTFAPQTVAADRKLTI